MTSADVPTGNHADEAAVDTLGQLCERARGGDQAAFEQLYRATVGRIHGLCLRMCANAALAEEATQATFIQAWQHLDTFRGDSRVTTWLHRIAVNEVLGSKRREARHQHEPNDSAETLGAASVGGPTTVDVDLERAIATLPDQARNVFVLFGVYGYGHRQTADFLGIAEGTSKAHYHAARRLLREALGEGGSN